MKHPRKTFLFNGPLIGLAIASLGFFGVPTAKAASFDCEAKELKADEKAICDSRALNDADVKMATTFELLSGLLPMGSRGDLQDAQSNWLKKRQACGADASCLKSAYEERLAQLSQTYKNINRPL